MRTTSLVLTTLVLLGSFTGAAYAAAGDHRPEGAGDQRADQGNQTAREARIAALHAARNASLASFQENRTAALATYHAAMNATKASFLENKTRVIEACQAAKNTTNESQCVRDGLKPLIAKARAEHADAREAFVQKLTEARKAAMASFAQARARAPQGA